MLVKIAMLGDSQVGKTSLMQKYVEGSFDDDYLQTLGVNFMDKTISLGEDEVTFSIWDIGGHRDFAGMLPMVCNDAVVVLFVFDLSRRSTLDGVRTWYTQARSHNKSAIPILVGAKYDLFVALPAEEQEEITNRARQYARAMRAPLVFCSPCYSVNVINLFKVILVVLFDLGAHVAETTSVGRPIVEYEYVSAGAHAC
jgi:GTP-binding protein of the ras superfamily involved in termination of M-phase